jgi:exopolyphosphatase/pppGpp-phosphohydrolase
LQQRIRADVIHLKISQSMSKEMERFLVHNLDLEKNVPVERSLFIFLADIIELYKIENPDWDRLKFPPLNSRFPERINDFGGDIFAAIASKDIVVHHPFESFDVVVQFLRQAARDPDVTAIWQTLYRTSNDSPIVTALIEAAKAGKKVVAVVEPKARFDEAANIAWGQGLQAAGATVIYGFPAHKVHSKITLVERGNEKYAHFGTGNYHPVTARIYTDISYFTCNKILCEEALAIFKAIVNRKIPAQKEFKKLVVAPQGMRGKLLELINNEAENAKAGKPSGIWIKLNALVDSELIDALYRASQAGVLIDMIIRGVCCLRPGVSGLSENIRVKSIVGRFLEHSRIFCFANGHNLPAPDRIHKSSEHQNNLVYIASADWMPRNMDHRIELMIPLENPTVHAQILGQVMLANLKDVRQSWLMQPDGSYLRIAFNDELKSTSFASHDFFLSNPSLSGRGSALHMGPRVEISDILENGQQVPTGLDVPTTKVAVMDIGSNSVRLVVFDRLKRAPLLLFNEKIMCGLARDLEKTGMMNKDGVKLAYKAIERFMHIVKGMEVEEIYCIATSAVRDSKDGAGFVRELEQKHKIFVRVLTGEEEAKYAAFGIASSFYDAKGVVGDLGGGSLELAVIQFSHTPDRKQDLGSDVVSYPIGSLRLRSLANGKRQKALEIIDKNLLSYPSITAMKGQTFYAIGGGFRSIAKVHMERTGYPLQILDHYTLKSSEIRPTLELLANSPPSALARMEEVSSSRIDTIGNAALLLDRIIELGKPAQLTFSTFGVREGLLFDKLPPNWRKGDVLLEGAVDMVRHLSPDTSVEWVEYGNELNDWLSEVLPEDNYSGERIRHAACLLSWLAWYEHKSYRGEMAYRWILNAELVGMSHKERVYLATALFHRYEAEGRPVGVMREAQRLISRDELKAARRLGLALKLGYALTGGVTSLLQEMKLTVEKKILTLYCPAEYTALVNERVEERLGWLAISLDLSKYKIVEV